MCLSFKGVCVVAYRNLPTPHFTMVNNNVFADEVRHFCECVIEDCVPSKQFHLVYYPRCK